MDSIKALAQKAYDEAFRRSLSVVEKNVVPDIVIRSGIRYLLSQRAKLASDCNLQSDDSSPSSGEEFYRLLQEFVEELKKMPVAVQTDAANEQHYEVPTEYFNVALGPHRKYSSCYYPTKETTLVEAEEAMLALCSSRAELSDGQKVLELGCGWGSWSLYMAAKYPGSSITAVSNSRTQKEYIDAQAASRGLKNLTIITANVAGDFEPPAVGSYDRVVSVEMFEHMKNYGELMRRVASWLLPGGKLFVHIFVHRLGLPWHYEVQGEDDWMTKYFFAGGTMPSSDLLLHFQDDLTLEKQYYVNGKHYSRTLEDWLVLHDKAKSTIMPLFEQTYGKDQALKWFVYWRLFYLACSELFAYEGGERWGVCHYLFAKKDA